MSLPEHIRKAIEEYVPHMEGWSTPEWCCELASRILETNSKMCLDVGVFAGRSTISMGFAARELVVSKVYGIDPWAPESASDNDDSPEGVDWWKKKIDLEDIQRQAVRAIWNHHLEQWVILIRSKSEYVADLFPLIDMINIDGGHSETTSCRDIELYLPKLKSGHYLTMDDAAWPSTQKAVRMIEEKCDLINVIKDKTESRTYRKR